MPPPAHQFEVVIESDEFTEEKYLLFENYQRVVHREPKHRSTRSGFKHFLCSSPLLPTKQTFDSRERKLGSYHQCYRLDGHLVAVGVLDLLPHAVSSVYFMYHESVHQWSFGKIGALTEAALAIEEGYKWYMMGFYIHNCVKMRYKGDYHPQYILDPESYTWDVLDEDFRRRLDARKYVSMSLEKEQGLPAEAVSKHDPLPDTKDNLETAKDNGEVMSSDEDIHIEDKPLSERNMPGIMTREQLATDVDLDHITLRMKRRTAKTSDLLGWDTFSINNPHSMKCIIADLVSAIGPALAADMCVAFD